MRRFLFALVAGLGLLGSACGLYFDEGTNSSPGTHPPGPDAPQQPYPDASTDDGGSYPDGWTEDGGIDGGGYPDALYPDAPCHPADGGQGYPDAAGDASVDAP